MMNSAAAPAMSPARMDSTGNPGIGPGPGGVVAVAVPVIVVVVVTVET